MFSQLYLYGRVGYSISESDTPFRWLLVQLNSYGRGRRGSFGVSTERQSQEENLAYVVE